MRKERSKIKHIIGEYKQALGRLGIDVQEVILYGSFAKGRQSKDSDIDLIIVSRAFENMNLRQRLEILGIAAARIMRPIEARGYTPAEISKSEPASFLEEVLASGVSV